MLALWLCGSIHITQELVGEADSQAPPSPAESEPAFSQAAQVIPGHVKVQEGSSVLVIMEGGKSGSESGSRGHSPGEEMD